MEYESAYKAEVCKRIVEGGEPAAQVGRELGTSENTIYTWVRWCRENREKPFFAGSSHTKAENMELKQLQWEVRELREENEIPKKAAAYFAKKQR